MTSLNKLNKVVIRTRDGKVIPGFIREDTIKDQVKVITRERKETVFILGEVKAIFFVKDFQGDPQYEEVKFLTKQPVSEKLWVRLVFFDGEILEGSVKNNGELLDPHGFYFFPSDRGTNNELVYIPKSALKELTILGVE